MNQASRVPRVITAAAGLGAATWIAMDSLNPQHYFRYSHQVNEPWTHPTGLVAFVALITLLEAWLLYGIVDERSNSASMWSRALMGLFVLGPWSYLSAMAVMHTPGFVRLHALWVLFLLTVVVGVLVVSGAGALIHWRHQVRDSE